MINLLATDRKADLAAARANVIILRYMGIIVLGFVFIFGALAVSYSVLMSTMNSAKERINTNTLEAGVYSNAEQEVSTLASQLNEANAVLEEETLYSSVLVQLGQHMPPGTIIGELTFTDETSNGTPAKVKVYAKSATDASLVQTQLQATPLFSNVTLEGIETSGGIDGYPVAATLQLAINRTVQ